MIILMFFLELGYLPTITATEYDHVKYYADTRHGYYVELGIDAEWRGLFIGGSAIIDMFKKKEGIQFWPISLCSEFGLGYRRGIFEAGYRHMCTHPVVPYFGMDRPGILRDQASNQLYVRITVVKEWE